MSIKVELKNIILEQKAGFKIKKLQGDDLELIVTKDVTITAKVLDGKSLLEKELSDGKTKVTVHPSGELVFEEAVKPAPEATKKSGCASMDKGVRRGL